MEYRKGDKILSIEQDELPGDPRDWDNIGIMICFHRGYNLGDKTELTSDSFSSWEDLEKYLIEEEKAVVILPLYLYDHSGLRMKVGSFHGLLPQGHARWDSGQVGFIYATKEALKEWTQEHIDKYYPGLTSEQVLEKVLTSEIETYDQYLMGNIWAFVLYEVKKCDLGYEHREVKDSCCGFYGTDFHKNGLLEHAGIEDLDDWEELQ